MRKCVFVVNANSKDPDQPVEIYSLGPVVQSVVSLTNSLRIISLTVLADSIHNILIFFAEKMWVAFALQKLLTFFQQKFQHICVSLDVNFKESLTNDIVSFEQLGPGQELCYTSLCSTVPNDSINGQGRSWSDCADTQSDLGLCCPHMPKDTFLNVAAHRIISNNS